MTKKKMGFKNFSCTCMIVVIFLPTLSVFSGIETLLSRVMCLKRLITLVFESFELFCLRATGCVSTIAILRYYCARECLLN